MRVYTYTILLFNIKFLQTSKDMLHKIAKKKKKTEKSLNGNNKYTYVICTRLLYYSNLNIYLFINLPHN